MNFDCFDCHIFICSSMYSYCLGKTIMETGFDIDSVVECLNYFASLSYSLNGEQVPIHSNALAYTIREPLGVCAGML